jgi:hypothetical protein
MKNPNPSRVTRIPKPFIALAWVGIFTITSCGQNGVRPTSALKHELNHPTNNDSPLMWQELDTAQLNEVVYPLYAAISGGESVAVMEAESSAVQRLQYWLDVMHDKLTQDYPEKMKSIVRPKAQVLVSRAPNAFVMPVPVCHDILTVLNKDEVANSFNTADGVAITRAGEVGRPWSSETCVKRGTDHAFLQEYIEQFNALGGTCQLSLGKHDGQDAVFVGDNCAREEAYQGVAAAKSLVLHPVAGIITVQSGLLTMMSEEEVVSVLAHELGHYYKVHIDHPFSSSYDYFYTLKESNVNGKPKSEAALASLGRAAQQAELPNRRYRVVPSQKFRTELFIPIMGLGNVIAKNQDCEAGECNEACTKFSDLVKSNAFRRSVGEFPFGALSEKGLKSYVAFESMAAACFKDVSVGDDKVKEGRSIEAKYISYVLSVDQTLAPMFAKSEIGDDLLTSLKNAERALENAEKELAAPLTEAALKAVGYYTTEQEADELSVEWMAKIGLDPAAVITSEFKLGDYVEGRMKEAWIRPHPTEIDMVTCKQLYANKWRNQSGKYVIVPIGDYEDPHHSTCFRAFNASREIDVHKLKPDTSFQRPAAPGGTWASIQQDVEQVHERLDGESSLFSFLRDLVTVVAPANDSGIDGEAFVKRNFAACPFWGNK